MESEKEQDEELEHKGLGVGEEEDDDILRLRRKICRHPLYNVLVETHLKCLKAQIGSMGAVDKVGMNLKQQDNMMTISQLSSTRNPSELDRFMETYCFALSKLKEAMEECEYKSIAFINSMHFQLKELTGTNAEAAAEKPTTTTTTNDSDTH